MSIPQSFIQDLLARTDVVEIVGRHVQLKKGGANFMGLCPFHGEKSPSFSVSPTKQFYHCFGCGAHGNAIGFLMEHVGLSFMEAVKDLAQQVGLQVPEDDVSPQERVRAQQQREKQATLTDVLEKAGQAWRQQLKRSQRAVAYCKGRGLSGEVARTFGLGYAPEGWHGLASVFPHYDDPLLVESGLVIQQQDEHSGDEKRYDRFRDRLMFPIRNVKGECIGFGGRVLGDEKPKYLNSPETPVFSKGRELYGLYEARTALREAGYVLVTEGYMDVVALAQHGFANAVATLGTACTPDHVQKLFRFTDAVVFSFDGDAAGRRAARKALEGALPYASDERSVKFLFLPSEHDPDSYIRELGHDAFAQAVAQAMPLSRFLMTAAREGCDLDSAEGRARMLSQARPLWSTLPEGALKRQLLGELAAAGSLAAADLAALWHEAMAPAPVRAEPPAAEDYQTYSERPRFDKGSGAKKWSKKKGGWSDRPAPPAGPAPVLYARPDHVLRLLLTRMALWDELSGEEHALLSALPAPHGPLMVWLEAQWHEHGPLPWAALQQGLQGHEGEVLANRLMDSPATQDTELDDAQLLRESRGELRDLLNRMQLEAIEAEERALAAQAATDPQALARYKILGERKRQLRVQAKMT